MLAWIFASVLGFFPISGGYAYSLDARAHAAPSRAASFMHWFLPFLSLFLVIFGGWAIGMRNMIIYELDADYSRYLDALGAPSRLVRRYAFRNAVLPQLTGLALAARRHRRRRPRDRDRLLSTPASGNLLLAAVQTAGLLPAPGHLPLRHHRRPDRQLPRRHRLRVRRSADPGRDGRRQRHDGPRSHGSGRVASGAHGRSCPSRRPAAPDSGHAPAWSGSPGARSSLHARRGSSCWPR